MREIPCLASSGRVDPVASLPACNGVLGVDLKARVWLDTRMDFNCPNCGHPIPDKVKTAVMLTCPSCDTTLYVQSDKLLNAGTSGEMHDGPQLFSIGDIVKLGRKAWEVLGHARFSYGRGWWDEYWCEDPKGNGVWISVDEGDIVVQVPVDENDERPALRTNSRIGMPFEWRREHFRVVETGSGECEAIRGVFGERLVVGDTFSYANAQGDEGTLLSAETDGTGTAWFTGEWHDPFEVSGTLKVVS